MKTILAALAFSFFAMNVEGAELRSTLKKYIEDATDRTDWEIAFVTRQAKAGVLIFGAATENRADESRRSVLFIARMKSDGTLKEIARSRLFTGVVDSNVESIEVQSDRRFSIQINGHSNAGGNVNVYRFAKVNETWQLAGLGEMIGQFKHEKDEVACDSRTVRSTNFLTGVVLAKEFIANKIASTKQTKHRFKTFPLSDFDSAYDDRFLAP